MKIKLPLLITTSILFFIVGHTQTGKKNKLEFSTGFNSCALKNLEVVSLAHYDYNVIKDNSLMHIHF